MCRFTFQTLDGRNDLETEMETQMLMFETLVASSTEIELQILKFTRCLNISSAYTQDQGDEPMCLWIY